MKQVLPLLFVFSLCCSTLFAESGDVTTVESHDTTELTWYGGYIEQTEFPDDSKEYQQISMDFTLGCSSGGCSHWDYTVQIQVGDPTGIMDSTVAALDTITTSPLVVDTTFNAPFEIIEWYELGRMITPYGNYMDYAWGGENFGYNESWKKIWTYDVTMFEPLLHGDKPVRVFFSGWPQGGRGFSAEVDFRYIEGEPLKRVRNIQKVYGGGTYNNSTQFEQDVLPSKTLNVAATNADLKMIITGHGGDGEFTPINYQLYADNTFVREELLWRDDCSENPLHPQGGTWVYNRTNWCPGDDVEEHWFDLSSYISSGTLQIDANFDDFTPPDNNASYIISGYLFEYEMINRQYDAAVKEIIRPNINGEHKTISKASSSSAVDFVRETTTVCSNPIIRIENLGKNELTYVQIKYGVVGGAPWYYEWTGNLKTFQSEEIVLPLINWNGLDENNPTFYAEVDYPNRLVDQFKTNNRKESNFNLPKVFDLGNLTFRLRANNQSQENSYTVVDNDGTVWVNKSEFTDNSINDENVNLPDGCYTLEFIDVDQVLMQGEGGDGLSFWVNTNNNLESSGYFEIRENNAIAVRFNGDFGDHFKYEFMVGEALNDQSSTPVNPVAPSQNSIETIEFEGETIYYMPAVDLYFTENNVASSKEQAVGLSNTNTINFGIEVFPNPSTEFINVVFDASKAIEGKLSLLNVNGQMVNSLQVTTADNLKIDCTNLTSGVYLLKFEFDNKSITKKVLLNNK